MKLGELLLKSLGCLLLITVFYQIWGISLTFMLTGLVVLVVYKLGI